jgi:hypothetical protein
LPRLVLTAGPAVLGCIIVQLLEGLPHHDETGVDLKGVEQ